MSWRHWVWATLALAALPSIQPAQTIGRVDDLAPGMFLVAPRELRDPNFRRSVVLLLQYERDGAMGMRGAYRRPSGPFLTWVNSRPRACRRAVPADGRRGFVAFAFGRAA